MGGGGGGGGGGGRSNCYDTRTRPGMPISPESIESILMLPAEARDLKDPPRDLPLCEPVKLHIIIIIIKRRKVEVGEDK